MQQEIMNKHLNPVFEEVIPMISSENIKYWVYGGVAISGIKGMFCRYNADVDIFVLNDDFDKTHQIITKYANQKEGTVLKFTELSSGRPKIELKQNGGKSDWFSAVPVYLVNGKVELKFNESNLLIDVGILEEVIRHINDYTFVTPPDNYIKMLFKHYLKTKRIMQKNKIDSKNFLNHHDLIEIFEVDR